MATLENKIAVILNRRAKRVTAKVAKWFANYRSERLQIYESGSLDELPDIAQDIVHGRYAVVASVGGDGTLYTTWNALHRAVQAEPGEMPSILLFKRGTGNGLAPLVQAGNYKKQLARIYQEEDFRKLPVRSLPLIEITAKINGEDFSSPTYYTFAGSGLDAGVLNDYNDRKEQYSQSWQRPFSEGLLGYLTAVFTRSIWREMRRDRFARVSIHCQGKLYRLAQHDRYDVEKEEVVEKDILTHWVDPVHAVVVGTTPYYGYQFRAFPFALLGQEYAGGMFHLRIITGPIAEVVPHFVSHAPTLWRGTYRSKYIQEFFANDITVEHWGSEEEVPFQIGGEALGNKSEIHYHFSDKKMKLVDYRKLR